MAVPSLTLQRDLDARTFSLCHGAAERKNQGFDVREDI